MAHQLVNPFSIYALSAGSPDANYEDKIKMVAKVSTVEEFWRAFSHIKEVQKFELKSAIHIFRGDSRAMREDPENINGGSFLIRVTKGYTNLGQAFWEKLVLCFIGGQLPSEVIGLVISPRLKFFNVSIWHQGIPEEEVIHLIEKIVKTVEIPNKFKIEHTFHDQVKYQAKEDGTHITQYTVMPDQTVSISK